MPYFDSRLIIDLEDYKKTIEQLRFCRKLGIKNIIIEPKNFMRKISKELKKKIEKETRVNIFFRVNLRPNNLNEFKKTINRYNNFPNILSIETSNKKIQIAAANDSRVDLLSFSNQNVLKTLTPGVISLTKQNNSFLEFSLAPLMVSKKSIQSKNSRNLYRFLQLAMKTRANFIINGNFKNLYDIRNPRSLVSICNTILEMPLVEAKKSFDDNVCLLIKRVENRQKKTSFEPGVKLINIGDKNG